MEHADFVTAWKEGQINVEVDRSKAIRVASSKMLPKRYRTAHTFWSWIWILSIPLGFAVGFMYKWWIGLLMVLFLTPMLSKSTKKSAMQFMIDHSLENPDFFTFAVNEEIISISEK